MAQSMKRTTTKVDTAPAIDEMSKVNFDFDDTSSDKRTAAEMRNWFEKNKRNIENYAKAKEGASTSLRDITKTSTKTVTAFSKETLRGYLQNLGSNEKNLRNLSRYLFYRSQPYYRLIMYNATMFELGARTITPNYDLIELPDKDSFLKDYQDTLNALDKMNLQYELLKSYITCFREDVFFGCAYYDETGFFILPLDPDYCKISGVYSSGDFAFAMDMTFFNGSKGSLLLEYWGEPFQSMHKEYQSSQQKWQPMKDEYAICLKARAEDYETVLPVFGGLLNEIISLIDLEDIQAIADKQDIYKMLWLELETITGSNTSDDWKISPDIVIDYFNRMINEALPDYVSAAVIPGKLDQVSFDSTAKVNDVNRIANATETLFNSSGGAQILNSKSISGTTAFEAAIEADTQFAISSLLGQTQIWLNRFLTYQVSNPSKVTFFKVSPYTKSKLKKDLLESCQYGFSNILAYNTLNGISEKTTIALNFLEKDCLDLVSKFIPLNSSYTSSGKKEAGGQEKDSGELTDAGEASRDKSDKSKG